MIKPLTPALAVWPALMAALAFGVVEWLALSRSRALDRAAAWRLPLTRR